MEYHKDQLAFSDRMEYIRAPLAVQAAHAWLIRHCARRENGGRILDSIGWKNTDWKSATSGQVSRRLLLDVVDAGLAEWHGQDLIVHGYDATGERECLRERQRLREYRERIKTGGRETQQEDMQNRTRTRTRTERVRDADQTSPVQTRPFSSQPPPLKGAAREEEKTPNPIATSPREETHEARMRRFQEAQALVAEIGADGIPGGSPAAAAALVRLSETGMGKMVKTPEDLALVRREWAGYQQAAMPPTAAT